MTIETIRKMMHQLHSSTRRQLVGTLAGPLVCAAFYGFALSQFALPRGLHLLFASAFAWSLLGLYFQNRGMWPLVMPEAPGLEAGMTFCRREIERRHLLLSRVLLWGLSPVILAIATFILSLARMAHGVRGLFSNAIPFLSLVALWLVGYFIMRWREQRQLKRELDALNIISRNG